MLKPLQFRIIMLRAIFRHKVTTLRNLLQWCRISRRTRFELSMLCLWSQIGINLPRSSLPRRCQILLGLLRTKDQNWFGILLKFLQTNLMVPFILGYVFFGRDKKDTFSSSWDNSTEF